jgi:hypothetical protein
MKEIEVWITKSFEAEKKIESKRVTKLNNEAAARNMADVQKELIKGRYKI